MRRRGGGHIHASKVWTYSITAFSTSSPCSSANTFPKARMVDKLENIRDPRSFTAFSDLLEAKNGIGPEVEQPEVHAEGRGRAGRSNRRIHERGVILRSSLLL